MATRFSVTRKHLGQTVEHRPKLGAPGRWRLISFETRGRFELAKVEFPGHTMWVDRADLRPVRREDSSASEARTG